MRTPLRIGLAVAATLAVLVPLGWFWVDSMVPSTYNMVAMGRPDNGGGPDAHRHGGLNVADLKGPSGTPDVAVTLVARSENGRFTLNGTSRRDRTIRARRGSCSRSPDQRVGAAMA